jgi:hypothetical protein
MEGKTRRGGLFIRLHREGDWVDDEAWTIGGEARWVWGDGDGDAVG